MCSTLLKIIEGFSQRYQDFFFDLTCKMVFAGFFRDLMEDYVFTTDPLGNEQNWFEALSIRRKTFVVLKNLFLWTCFVAAYLLVFYVATFLIEPLHILINVAGEVAFWFLRPILGDDVYALDNRTVRAAWWATWASLWLTFFYVAQGVTFFEITCISLFVGASLQILKILLLGVPIDERFYNVHNDADRLVETFNLHNEFSWRIGAMRLFGYDAAIRLEFGTWRTSVLATSYSEFMWLAAFIGVYTFLAYFLKQPSIQGTVALCSVPFKRLTRPPCSGGHGCTHPECSICLERLCGNVKATNRIKLAVRQQHSKLRIAASNIKPRSAVILDCDHAFHEDCIDRWLKCRASCPSCRADVSDSKNAVKSDVFSSGFLIFGCFLCVQLCYQLIIYFGSESAMTDSAALLGTSTFNDSKALI